MILESWWWKQEIRQHIEDIERYSKCSYSADCSECEGEEFDAEEYAMFRLERALAYSAIAVRLIADASKLSDEMEAEIVPTEEYAPLKPIGQLEKCADSECFDFEHPRIASRSARFLINQIIHSYVVTTYQLNEEGKVDSFLVSSDRQKEKSLIKVKLCDWVPYLKRVTEDDIVMYSCFRNEEGGCWIIAKKSCNRGLLRNEDGIS